MTGFLQRELKNRLQHLGLTQGYTRRCNDGRDIKETLIVYHESDDLLDLTRVLLKGGGHSLPRKIIFSPL